MFTQNLLRRVSVLSACFLIISNVQLQAQKKEPFKWYVSWTITSSETYAEESGGNIGALKGTFKEHYSKQINHSGTEVFRPQQTPDLSGAIGISQENGDSLVLHQQSGNYSYNYYEEETDNLGLVQKTTITANGPPTEVPYIEFEYHPDEKAGGINAGSWFNVTSNKNVLAREDGSTSMKNINSQDSSEEHLQIGQPGDKIIKTKDGYIVDGTIKEDTSYFDEGSGFAGVAHGGKKVERHSVITYHVTISSNPQQYDAILEVVNGAAYDNWLPQGSAAGSPGTKGNAITFNVYLEDKSNPGVRVTDKKFDVDYTLSDVSKEPGYCNNYPLKNANDNPDIIFDSAIAKNTNFIYKQDEVRSKDFNGDDQAVKINSYDYGSYSKLKVNVTLENGATIEAHFKGDNKTTISLPKDDNNNHVADEWENQNNIYEKNYSADWDDEQQDGNSNNGDGLTLYEEYRGIMAKGQHKRLRPDEKDIVIANTTTKNLHDAMFFFARGCSMQIVPIEVKAEDELDINNPVVNKNSSSTKKGDQHGIVLKIINFASDNNEETINGQAFVKNDISNDGGGLQSHRAHEPVAASPKDVDSLAIDNSINKADSFNYAFAHELAHCLGVQHHGNSKPYFFNSFDRYIIQDSSLTFISEDGTPQNKSAFLDNLQKSVPMLAALAGSEASGDAGCIMCYNQDFEYSFPKGAKGKILYVCNFSTYPLGEYFCSSKVGTRRNAPDKKPSPVFGNATTGGNCISQFKVKDW